MNWNQEELDQWALAQQQKEEDNQALNKYRCMRCFPCSNKQAPQLMMIGACQPGDGFDKMLLNRAKAQQLHLPTCVTLTPTASCLLC